MAGHQTAVYNRDRNSEIQSIAVAVNHYIFEGATTAKIIVGELASFRSFFPPSSVLISSLVPSYRHSSLWSVIPDQERTR